MIYATFRVLPTIVKKLFILQYYTQNDIKRKFPKSSIRKLIQIYAKSL